MQLTTEQILAAVRDGAAEAINAATSEIGLIADQINGGLQENEVEKVQYQVTLPVKITVDVNARKIIATGGYGAKTANLKKWGQKIEREIEDPEQGQLFDNTEGQSAPEETETNEDE